MTFLVVFDTCTHAGYYGDVHQVLALPEGAVIRYEYKRYLYTDDAAAAVEALAANPSRLPVPVLLIYGQKQAFTKGSGDPASMLAKADSFFVPTRSANLVAVAVEKTADHASDVLYLHLQLRGFVNPDIPAFDELVMALEAENALPFGDKQTQYSWISLLPAALVPKRNQLVSEDQAPWTRVVDKLITLPTQFKDDVFWRVRRLTQVTNGQIGEDVPLRDRRTNKRVHSDSWFRDYVLYEGKRYAVAIQTHSPENHGTAVAAGSTVAMTSLDDDDAVLKLSADPMQLVPNQIDHKRFKISISTDAAFDTRYTGIRLETQVPGYTSPYAPGSLCLLTFSVRKERWRYISGIVFILASVGIAAGTVIAKPTLWWGVSWGVGAAALGALGLYLIFKQVKIGK
jgi:hypothetical protein